MGINIDAISYSNLRSNWAGILDKVNDDHTPVLLNGEHGKPAVVISLDDFKSYQETVYLMASSKNAARLSIEWE